MDPLSVDPATHLPVDEQSLWWLGNPAQPIRVGTLSLVRANRSVSLRYDPHWRRAGFALSEDLPLTDQTFIPTEKDTAAGAVNDARPDRWGERVIRFLDKPARLSLMEYLLFAGDERFGALGVSARVDDYQPRLSGPLPQLQDLAALHRLVQQVLAGEPVLPEHRHLLAPGATLGGARPKALMNLDGAAWVVKFPEHGDAVDSPLMEHSTLTLAARAGIWVAHSQPLPLATSTWQRPMHAVAVKRFDRVGTQRRHAISADVALRAAGEPLAYPALAQILRRRGVVQQQTHIAHMHELFRRMVFNILTDNTDDHEKNHVLLMNDRNEYELAPAFDMLPALQSLGYQQLQVGTDMADATLANALTQAHLFGLKTTQAHALLKEVVAVVSQWRPHFAQMGITERDLDTIAQHLDRPFLRSQRQEWGGR
jgi:serine/threonine-protein kinase HipA